ncbi:uncharacterized protein [Henckelia pumila]|uniref:uncharacterized protein n=1 Tax=Henckelia pumila TaxID=405737 RepID=UPI003C6DC900
MTTLERLNLEDLQDLEDSFANLKVVDLKMNFPEGEQSIGNPPRYVVKTEEPHSEFHVGGNSHSAGTRSRKSNIPIHQTPYGKTVLDPIYPYGIMLNLDVLDFKNREDLIDDWTSAMRIAAGTLDLNKEGFIKLLEMILMGSVKIAWEMTMLETKESILAGELLNEIGGRMATLFKAQFIGVDYFNNQDTEKKKRYTQALYSLELHDIYLVDEYIMLFTKYRWNSGVEENIAIQLFFAKMPSPWREMLIKEYVPGNLDTLARRASFLKGKLAEWCHMAVLQKNYKKIRGINKHTPLCCRENDLPTIIGNKSQGFKRKKFRNNPYNKRMKSSWKPRTFWSKQKVKGYRSGRRSGPTSICSGAPSLLQQARWQDSRLFRKFGVPFLYGTRR